MILRRLLAVALAAAVLPVAAALAATEPQRAALSYDINLGGFSVAQAELLVTLGPQGYQVESRLVTVGLAGRLVDFTTQAQSVGVWEPDGPQPTRHRSDTLWRGSQRVVELVYDRPESPPRTEVHPPPAAEDREPVPEQARAGTMDPMSGILALMNTAARQAGNAAAPPGEDPVPVFDGRRLYTLALGSIGPSAVSVQGYEGNGWRAVVHYERKHGKSRSTTMFRRDTGTGSAEMLLAPGGEFGLPLPVPARVEVATRTMGGLVVLLTDVRVLPPNQADVCVTC